LLGQVEAKRGAIVAASSQQAQAIKADGEREAERARTSSAESVSSIQSVAASKIAQHAGDPKASGPVREAVQETASQAVAKIVDNGRELAAKARAGASDKARGFRAEGTKVAAGIGDKTADVQKVLNDATASTVRRVAGVATNRAGVLGELHAKSGSALDRLHSSVAPHIRRSGAAAAASARAISSRSAQGVVRTQKAGVARLHRGVRSASRALARLPSRRRRQGAQQLTGAMNSALAGAGAALGGALNDVAAAGMGQIEVLGSDAPRHLNTMVASATASADRLGVTVEQGFGQVSANVNHETGQALADGRAVHDQAVGGFAANLQQGVDKANQSWGDERAKGAADIRSDIDKGLDVNRRGEGRAAADLDAVAEGAAADAHRSLFGQIVHGIWEGIKTIASGLLLVLGIAALAFGLLALLGIIAFSWSAFLAVLAVVGLVFLVVGLVKALDRRIDEMVSVLPADTPWYMFLVAAVAVVGVSIGDVIGITPIVEGILGENVITGRKLTPEQRAEKITEGVLSILLILLLKRVFKEAPPEEPIDDQPPLVIDDPYGVLGSKYGLRPDVVEMLRASKVDPALLDSALARGIDPVRVALVADEHGAVGIKILNSLSDAGIDINVVTRLLQNAKSMGNMETIARLAQKGTLGSLLRRGFDADEVVLLADEIGAIGLDSVDGLMDQGVERNPALESARLAKQVGAADDVKTLVRSRNLLNPRGLRNFLRQVADEVDAGQEGKLRQLQEAAKRSASGRVALERAPEGQADVIDFGKNEALQIKVVTSKSEAAVVDNAAKAASQLRGETGEIPPPGMRKIADVRIENANNPLADLERPDLLRGLRDNGLDATKLGGVDVLRVTNRRGSFDFSPSEF
jgi:hypothetical protein